MWYKTYLETTKRLRLGKGKDLILLQTEVLLRIIPPGMVVVMVEEEEKEEFALEYLGPCLPHALASDPVSC